MVNFGNVVIFIVFFCTTLRPRPTVLLKDTSGVEEKEDFKRMMWDCGVYLLVDPAVRGSVVDEDADDVHVSPPGGQVQREATLAVSHVCGRLKLEQL